MRDYAASVQSSRQQSKKIGQGNPNMLNRTHAPGPQHPSVSEISQPVISPGTNMCDNTMLNQIAEAKYSHEMSGSNVNMHHSVSVVSDMVVPAEKENVPSHH